MNTSPTPAGARSTPVRANRSTRQCRRDCPKFRAIEDRLQNIVDFLFTGRPADLYRARGLASPDALTAQLHREFCPNAVARGRTIFANNCAQCHSSVPDSKNGTTDFRAVVPGRPDLRADFLSSEKPVDVTASAPPTRRPSSNTGAHLGIGSPPERAREG